MHEKAREVSVCVCVCVKERGERIQRKVRNTIKMADARYSLQTLSFNYNRT